MGERIKIKGNWDMTADQQLSAMDEIYELQKTKKKGGNATIPLKGACISNPILPKEVLKNIAMTLKDSMDVIQGDGDKEYTLETSYPSVDDETNETSVFPINTEMFHDIRSRFIQIRINEELNRLVVDDGIAPTSVALDVVFEQEIAEEYDAEEIGDIVGLLSNYLISLKHPMAMFTTTEFLEKFGNVSKYNNDLFTFLTAQDYVMCYITDPYAFKNLDKMIEEWDDFEIKDFLKVYSALCISAGIVNQAFYVEDASYLRTFYNSTYNLRQDFTHMFFTHNETKTSDDEENDNSISAVDTPELQALSRKKLEEILGESYFGFDEDYDEDADDEYDDDEEGSDDPGEDIKQFVEDMTKVYNKPAEELAKTPMKSEEKPLTNDTTVEKKTTEETVKPAATPIEKVAVEDADPENMILPVIR